MIAQNRSAQMAMRRRGVIEEPVVKGELLRRVLFDVSKELAQKLKGPMAKT